MRCDGRYICYGWGSKIRSSGRLGLSLSQRYGENASEGAIFIVLLAH